MQDRRSSSGTVNQFGTIRLKQGSSAGHKDYLKNMLVSRLQKKFPRQDNATTTTIDAEVNLFCQSEYVTKESMKQLELRVSRKLNRVAEESEHLYTEEAAHYTQRGSRMPEKKIASGNMSQEIGFNLDIAQTLPTYTDLPANNQRQLSNQKAYASQAKTLRRNITNKIRMVDGAIDLSAAPTQRMPKNINTLKELPSLQHLSISNG